MEKQSSASRAILWAIGLLLLASLACAQAGEILSPAEATARAEEARSPTRPAVTPESAGGAEFQPGDSVKFISTGNIVPLMRNPGDSSAFVRASAGDTATVLGSQEVQGELWYQVNGASGEGWVEAKYLGAVEGETSAPEGPQAGDTVYLASKAYLIQLVAEPGGTRMIAFQERGTEVIILELAEHEGEIWYKIDAPSGEGWVPAENIATEKP